MNTRTLKSLTPRQLHVLVVSMQVRNALEDFHVANLSGGQMKELNQIVRYAIYDAVELIEPMDGDEKKGSFFEYLVEMVPDYWEIPGRDPRPAARPGRHDDTPAEAA